MTTTAHKDRIKAEFAKRLSQAMDHRGLPHHGRAKDVASEFVKRNIPMTSMSVGRWLKGITMPSRDNTRVLSEILGVRQPWLEKGEGAMVEIHAETPEGEEVRVMVRHAPLLRQNEIIAWCIQRKRPERSILIAGDFSPETFVFEMPDNSMAPDIPKGSLMIVDPLELTNHDQGYPVVMIDGESAIVGDVIYRGDVLLEPRNPSYQAVKPPPGVFEAGAVVALAQRPIA